MAKNKKRNGKTQSLSMRQKMFPVEQYGEMVREIPVELIGERGGFPFFGSPVGPMLLKKRRTQLGLTHSKDNTLIFENDTYFINGYKKDAPDVEADIKKITYEEYIKDGNTSSMKFRIDNKPYNWPGQGASRLWAELVKADNKHGILDWQGDILPTALQRGQDAELREMRDLYFNDYGLYKIRTVPFDAFSEWGADVETAMYFCRKGYDGDISIKTDISEYKFDFKSLKFIVTPDTLVELEFILNCLKQDSYKFKSNKHYLDGKEIKGFKNNEKLFSMEKSSTFKYPIVTQLKTTENVVGYTSKIIDLNYDKPRLVIPYQVGGYDGGKREIGVVKKIEAGLQIGSYLVEENINTNLDLHSRYLSSKYPKYLQYVWRTSKTNDFPQLKVIPKLTDFNVQTDEDILEFLGGKDIKKEIENAYRRKTQKK